MINGSAVPSDLTFAQLTTMRVGGPVERMLVAETREALVLHALDVWRHDDPWLLLGGGSNTVVSDEGYPGTVLLVRTDGIERVAQVRREGRVRLRVQAGHDWDQLVAFTVDQGWAGLEALSGIPGLAGAAPVQNIGAYGAELSDVLHSIEFLDAETHEVVRLHADELDLSYRNSVLKAGRQGVVLSIDIELEATGLGLSAPVRYGQLAQQLGVQQGDRVPVRELREAVLALRRSKSMVLDEADRDSWSAGSFFTNPVVTVAFARTLPADAPRYVIDEPETDPVVISLEDLQRGAALPMPVPAGPRRVKLSAAWLIEQAGISRGFRIPGSGAAISSKHTLAITNQGGASAADVAELARFVVQRVQQEFGVILVPEPRVYGLEI